MALSGSFNTSSRTSGGATSYFQFSWTASQSLANNTSSVSWTVKMVVSPSTYVSTPCYLNQSGKGVTVNGTLYGFSRNTTQRSNGYQVASGTTTITHNNDGTKSFSVSISSDIGGDAVSGSQSFTLDTIPRASKLSVPASVTINNTTGSIPVTITPQNSSFYTRLYYSLSNGKSGYSNMGTSTSAYYTYTSLLDLIPQSNVSMTVTLVTYSDTGYANEVGRESSTISLSIDTNAIKPSISIGEQIVVDTTNISGYCFAGFGKVRAKFVTTNSRGSSGVTTTYSISYGSLATTSSTSTSAVTVTSNTMPLASTNRTGVTITATAKDSRGAVASVTTNAITIYGYTPPSISGNFFRSNNQGSADEQGVYAYGNWSASVGTSTGSNAIQSVSSTFNSNRPNTVVSLAQTSSATYTVTATDKVGGTTTQSFSVASAIYPLQLLDNGGGKVGVGMGVPASENLVQSALPIHEMRGHFVHSTYGQNGQDGLAKICTINTDVAYINTPITFTIHARTTMPFHVTIRFVNQGSGNPGLSLFQGDTDHGVYLAKTSTYNWALFVRKSEAYDTIIVDDIQWREDYIRNYIHWENDGKSWTDTELQALTGLTGLSRLNKKIDIYGTATTANNIDIVNADGVANAGWRTDVNGNLVHKRTTASDTFNIMSNNATAKWALQWENGDVTSYAHYPLKMKYARNNDNTYIANNSEGIYITAKSAGDTIFLETYNTDIFHALNGENRRIFDDGNIADNWKLLYSGDYAVTSTTNTTLTNGARYQMLAFNMRTGTDSYFRWSMVVPTALLPTAKGSGYWGVAGTSQYGGVYLWKSGNNVIMCGGASGNTGNIYYVYGVGGAR